MKGVQLTAEKLDPIRQKQEIDIEPEYQNMDVNEEIPIPDVERQTQDIDREVHVAQETSDPIDSTINEPLPERSNQQVDVDIQVNKNVEEVQNERILFNKEEIQLDTHEIDIEADRSIQESEENEA